MELWVRKSAARDAARRKGLQETDFAIDKNGTCTSLNAVATREHGIRRTVISAAGLPLAPFCVHAHRAKKAVQVSCVGLSLHQRASRALLIWLFPKFGEGEMIWRQSNLGGVLRRGRGHGCVADRNERGRTWSV